MSLTCCIKSHRKPASLASAHTPCHFSIDLHTVKLHLVIAHFLLLLLLFGTLFKMLSGMHHHCHLCFVERHTCFVQSTKTEILIFIAVHMSLAGRVNYFSSALRKYINVYAKSNLSQSFHCLLILMILYVMPVKFD